MKGALAFDTSNYTTSVAYYSPAGQFKAQRLLKVPQGGLGLRQSEALFQHIKQLPELVKALFADPVGQIVAVGASTVPRETEGSYMPCFLAGQSQGVTTARILDVPFFPWSHQQGHLAAAAWSAGHMELLERPFLAWHLSGGTTELLKVVPAGCAVTAHRVGGTTDISAGQLIDRAGVLLGLDFPAGKALDALSGTAQGTVKPFPVKLNGLEFSLSGMENKVRGLAEQGEAPCEVARFVLETLAQLLRQVTVAAQNDYPGLPVLCSGGVASNRLIRYQLTEFCQAVFSTPDYASDNAMGVALLTYRAWEGAHG